MPLSPLQVAWIRAEYLRLHAQYYQAPDFADWNDYARGSAWGDLMGYARLMQAFGIPVDPDHISPAETGWASEALKNGLL